MRSTPCYSFSLQKTNKKHKASGISFLLYIGKGIDAPFRMEKIQKLEKENSVSISFDLL